MADEDFIYERQRIGKVKLETVTDGTRYKGKVWYELARQIYCENGKDDFRDIGHFASGAPFLFGEDVRISISHTQGCFAVATINVPEGTDLSVFTPEAALGIDVEHADRSKASELRERFLSQDELKMLPESSVENDLIAWTCKEAMLKAGMDSSIDWRNNIVITQLPAFSTPGSGHIFLNDQIIKFTLTTLSLPPFIITIATT